MKTTQDTALSLLKAQALSGLAPSTIGIEDVLPHFLQDKGYSAGVVLQLARENIFGQLVGHLLMKGRSDDNLTRHNAAIWNYFGGRIRQIPAKHRGIRSYIGAPADNSAADRLITNLNGPKGFIGEGAAGFVNVSQHRLPHQYRDVPIAIIGAGPAGIMLQRGLRRLGFEDVRMFEKREEFGIWSQKNVYEGSRNNPRDVLFDSTAKLDAAPGGGHEVRSFLREVKVKEPTKLSIKKIEPKDLDHTVIFTDGTKRNFPIVINAMGLGKPVEVSDPERMIGPEKRTPAKRWQQPNLSATDVKGKRFIFIGLGNSTAEMIRQLHRYEDAGIDVDYRILTHYPRDSVFGPSDTVYSRGTNYRVFRDISKPQLVSYQGDLPEARSDYYRALMSGRIISDVKKWDVDARGKKMAVYSGKSSPTEIQFDDLYLLAGYRHSPEAFKEMGCTYDHDLRCALHDYDGEIIRKVNIKGGDRVHRGYFGFGAVLDAPHNLNSVVIPGMAFRLPDLLFGIVMRAGEYVQKTQQ